MSARLIFLFLIYAALPPENTDPVHPPEEEIGKAFESLGCTCGETISNGYQCDALPAFEDNDWTHQDAKKFARRAEDFAATVETVVDDLHGRYHLALQGWADQREIQRTKAWSQASPECMARAKKNPDDEISNLGLAFLRACELRQSIRKPLAEEIDLLPPVDFSDPKNRSSQQHYSGNTYKSAVLFIIFPDRSVCGHANRIQKEK